ncbi:MAG: phosphotransferase [Pseudomonadota bacterium]
MLPTIQDAIERHYDLRLVHVVPGSRQFVAETYVLETACGQQYFCKITSKPLFIREIIPALPLVAYLHHQGIERICRPIATRDQALSITVGDRLVVLHTYIDGAVQSYDYDVRAYGQLVAQIHGLATPEQGDTSHREDFTFPYGEYWDERFEQPLRHVTNTPIDQAFQRVLRRHEDQIRRFKIRFEALAVSAAEKQAPLVITHGDGPGNVLMRAPQDIYLIDWDEAMVTPAERDIWMIDHVPGFLEGYRDGRPDFMIDQDLRGFYTLKYFFQRHMHYTAEILNEELDEATRRQHLSDMDRELSEKGWMAPRLAEVWDD